MPPRPPPPRPPSACTQTSSHLRGHVEHVSPSLERGALEDGHPSAHDVVKAHGVMQRVVIVLSARLARRAAALLARRVCVTYPDGRAPKRIERSCGPECVCGTAVGVIVTAQPQRALEELPPADDGGGAVRGTQTRRQSSQTQPDAVRGNYALAHSAATTRAGACGHHARGPTVA